MDSIKTIAKHILELAKSREKQSSDLVASVHNIWMEIGLVLAEVMAEIRSKKKQNCDK